MQVSNKDKKTVIELSSSASTACPICYETVLTGDIIRPLACGHEYCFPCATGYFKDKMATFKVLNIGCPCLDCQQIFSETAVQSIFDKDTFEAFHSLYLLKIMNQNTKVKLCPKPGCAKQFKASAKHPFTACTSCKTTICNTCCNYWHEDKTCLEAIDPAFQVYAKSRDIRFCLMCRTNVEKVEGCKHITCPVCDYEWCWDCGRQYSIEHQPQCPGEWSPIPPVLSMPLKLKQMWWRSSIPVRIILTAGGILFSPLYFLLALLLWPIWLIWEAEGNVDRKKPLKSVSSIFAGLIIGVLFLPIGLILAIVLGLRYLLTTSVTALVDCIQGVPKNQPSQDEEAPKTEERWIHKNVKKFVYTPNSTPKFDVQADGKVLEHVDLEAQVPA